jgi:hypothetical protein
MKTKIMIFAALLFFAAINVFAQDGGKAEPNRIKFAKGKSSATVSGQIYGDVQAEYVFTVKAGQTVTLKITSIPKGKFAAFKVVNDAGAPEFVSERDSNYDYIFTAPYSGNYVVSVHFRPAGKVDSARYNLTLSIK